MTKIEIRTLMQSKRNELDEHTVKEKSQKLNGIINAHQAYQKAKSVGIFYPMRNELDLMHLQKDPHKIFCFPKVEGNNLVFYEVDQHTTFEKSRFGVFEPTNAQPIKQPIDLLIVPALAISKEKHRIGYGKGFYDRYIEKNKPKYTLGVIYDFQEIDTFETNANDQMLKAYIKV